jgi:hypothetical protein
LKQKINEVQNFQERQNEKIYKKKTLEAAREWLRKGKRMKKTSEGLSKLNA